MDTHQIPCMPPFGKGKEQFSKEKLFNTIKEFY
jgi:hypothetical protein